jgi:hypothetical protein
MACTRSFLRAYRRDILNAPQTIRRFVAGVSKDEFLANEETARSSIQNGPGSTPAANRLQEEALHLSARNSRFDTAEPAW